MVQRSKIYNIKIYTHTTVLSIHKLDMRWAKIIEVGALTVGPLSHVVMINPPIKKVAIKGMQFK